MGTELNYGVEYAQVAQACGLQGVKVDTAAALEKALTNAIEDQMKNNKTTLIEVVVNQEPPTFMGPDLKKPGFQET